MYYIVYHLSEVDWVNLTGYGHTGKVQDNLEGNQSKNWGCTEYYICLLFRPNSRPNSVFE